VVFVDLEDGSFRKPTYVIKFTRSTSQFKGAVQPELRVFSLSAAPVFLFATKEGNSRQVISHADEAGTANDIAD
jgi:hypothetical protein